VFDHALKPPLAILAIHYQKTTATSNNAPIIPYYHSYRYRRNNTPNPAPRIPLTPLNRFNKTADTDGKRKQQRITWWRPSRTSRAAWGGTQRTTARRRRPARSPCAPPDPPSRARRTPCFPLTPRALEVCQSDESSKVVSDCRDERLKLLAQPTRPQVGFERRSRHTRPAFRAARGQHSCGGVAVKLDTGLRNTSHSGRSAHMAEA
jgi:hypothetical protein